MIIVVCCVCAFRVLVGCCSMCVGCCCVRCLFAGCCLCGCLFVVVVRCSLLLFVVGWLLLLVWCLLTVGVVLCAAVCMVVAILCALFGVAVLSFGFYEVLVVGWCCLFGGW